MKIQLLQFLLLVWLGIWLWPADLALASNILSAYKYAWSNNAGYINFSNVTVGDEELSGYAWSANYGWINLAPAQGGVSNDGAGNLSGSAWGQQLGWINFGEVEVDPSTGIFSGTATGDIIGTLTFDCSYCDVRTDWRGGDGVTGSSVGGTANNGWYQVVQSLQNAIALLRERIAALPQSTGLASITGSSGVVVSVATSSVVQSVWPAEDSFTTATSSAKTSISGVVKSVFYKFIGWLSILFSWLRY